MYLLYVDESGSTKLHSDCQVLAGVLVHESQIWAFRERLDSISTLIPASNKNRELHASHMEGGRGRWRGTPRSIRDQITFEILGSLEDHQVKVFAVVMEAVSAPVSLERGYETLFHHASTFIGRQTETTKEQGMAILDETPIKGQIERLVRRLHTSGRQPNPLSGFAEVPMFLDSSLSRPLQAADFVAFWVHRAYAFGEIRIFNALLPAFDQEEGGPIHGLVHLIKHYQTCGCAACRSRR